METGTIVSGIVYRKSIDAEPACRQAGLDYIHQNPVKATLVLKPEDYKYSSASYYELGVDEFGFLTHYSP